MKKYFVVSDIHSYYDELMESLDKAGFDINNNNHIFVSCGDLLDRGTQPLECLQFVNNLPDDRKILIRGNHEDLLEDCIKRRYFTTYDYHNFTTDTMQRLCRMTLSEGTNKDNEIFDIIKNNNELSKYLSSIIDYYELNNYVFVHGWIPPVTDWKNGDWKEARWLNGMKMWNDGYKLKDKTIVCGHWHTSWGHSKLHHWGLEFNDKFLRKVLGKDAGSAHFRPFEDKGIIAIDACTAYSHRVNCITIEE